MSQQRNPATLREALSEARKVIVVACGDKAPYVKVALARIDAALAASGTEAAPEDKSKQIAAAQQVLNAINSRINEIQKELDDART